MRVRLHVHKHVQAVFTRTMLLLPARPDLASDCLGLHRVHYLYYIYIVLSVLSTVPLPLLYLYSAECLEYCVLSTVS